MDFPLPQPSLNLPPSHHINLYQDFREHVVGVLYSGTRCRNVILLKLFFIFSRVVASIPKSKLFTKWLPIGTYRVNWCELWITEVPVTVILVIFTVGILKSSQIGPISSIIVTTSSVTCFRWNYCSNWVPNPEFQFERLLPFQLGFSLFPLKFPPW